MIEHIISLVNSLKKCGQYEYADKVAKIAHKLAITKCIASFRYPIQLSNGNRISLFEYKVNSPEQMMAAIPQVLAKKHHQVWFLGKNYQLPSHSRILAAKLLEEKMLGNIICECYIEEK